MCAALGPRAAARSWRGHSLTQHGGHSASDHAPARHHYIVERRSGGCRAEWSPWAGPQPPTEQNRQRPAAGHRHGCGREAAPPAPERKRLGETRATPPGCSTSSRPPGGHRLSGFIGSLQPEGGARAPPAPLTGGSGDRCRRRAAAAACR